MSHMLWQVLDNERMSAFYFSHLEGNSYPSETNMKTDKLEHIMKATKVKDEQSPMGI